MLANSALLGFGAVRAVALDPAVGLLVVGLAVREGIEAWQRGMRLLLTTSPQAPARRGPRAAPVGQSSADAGRTAPESATRALRRGGRQGFAASGGTFWRWGTFARRPKKVIGMMWYDGWGWGGWFAMAIFMVLFWVLVIAGVVVLVRYLTGSHRPHQGGPSAGTGEAGWGSRRAEDVLAERFARGEIDEDEFKRRLTLLREHR
ncbi:hypothetical protein [Streptomyces sp. GbtcB7]|uniref:SHOCT domain-containing protein n=1 Tax=Streptomyces sp. GbtcB7 TaxID=2824752 RepID=UPI0027E47290|nr:hypothetical protein [Streptomyces sp. GbtcB7]